ncbi:MAG: fructose-1,6-bisphosphatase [Nitrospirae bacterium]|nr:fructose-1,6-bisphosphatase [Nitrospirota bacterium]
MREFPLTLNRFIIQSQASHQGATGEFSGLLTQIGLVGKLISEDLRRAGLINILGTTGDTNVQGETVKKLDAIANDDFVKVFQHSGYVCALASEEMEKPISMPGNWPQGKYMLLFDPLDGSSNTDNNMPLGAIFSVLKYDRADRLPTEGDMIRRGTEQVAAGYLLYGSSTMLVYTVGQGVYGFTLEPGIGEYLLSHAQIRIPDNYLYPGEVDKPEGKLRLLYEANPLAFVVEQAGGKASTGTSRIMEVEPKKLHQRVPLIIGSRLDVEQAEAYIQGRA